MVTVPVRILLLGRGGLVPRARGFYLMVSIQTYSQNFFIAICLIGEIASLKCI